ncbi:MAG: aminopeptidase P family protein [Fimbriimonadaceae bacterium]|nr:aminopeptidase P family protein [Fimbriimonadaceae bacterium]
MPKSLIPSEKLRQAADLVAKSDADVWLTFVRETALGGDPVLPLILEGGLTWQSALMVGKNGKKVAVVGNYDADPLKASGDWDEVVPYVQSIKEPLLAALEELVAQGGKIAVNYSINDVKADGLSHGMFLLLQDYLKGTRFEQSMVSAEPIVMALRGQKTPSEIFHIEQAIAETDRMFEDIAGFARLGVTEWQVYDFVHQKAYERELGFSWDSAGDPIVNSGPDSMVGHGIPSNTITIERGHIFHIDLGLLKLGYASDIQRCWYVPLRGEVDLPADVARAMEAVTGAIQAGFAAVKPGVLGHEVDAAARAHLVSKGYPEYMHAFGHQVGRVAHDGGAILGPKWQRYGNTPMIPLQENEVYTLELGVDVTGRGYLGIEEMVAVTADGARWLSVPQTTLPLLEE